jgi:hypothetical protein
MSVQVVPSPSNPAIQAHAKDPSLFVQTALASQLSVSIVHSSMSVQVVPSPSNPALQVHVKESSVSTQSALVWQLCSPVVHSSVWESMRVSNRNRRSVGTVLVVRVIAKFIYVKEI